MFEGGNPPANRQNEVKSIERKIRGLLGFAENRTSLEMKGF